VVGRFAGLQYPRRQTAGSYTHALTDNYTFADTNAGRDAPANRHPHDYTYAHTHGHADTDPHPDRHTGTDRDSDADGHPHALGYTYCYADGHEPRSARL
jgi:hypothetical protein